MHDLCMCAHKELNESVHGIIIFFFLNRNFRIVAKIIRRLTAAVMVVAVEINLK